jgi:hypothetical protein
MKSEIYTPDLESQLIQYYHENVPKYFDRLNTFINYTDEVKDLLLDDCLIYCKSKQDGYDKSKSSPIRFFKTILTRITMVKTEALINYLDTNSKYHQYQVEVNSNYWKSFLTRAKREYDLKNILIYTKK